MTSTVDRSKYLRAYARSITAEEQKTYIRHGQKANRKRNVRTVKEMLNLLLDLRGATVADVTDFAEGKRKDEEPGTGTIINIEDPDPSGVNNGQSTTRPPQPKPDSSLHL